MFQPVQKTHQDRVAAAQQLLVHLHEKYGDRLRAVGLYGSSARDEDLPYSDLELLTVVAGSGLDERHEFIVGGLKYEIDVVTEDVALREIENVGLDWPLYVGIYATARPLFDPIGQLDRLRARVDEVTAQDFRPFIRQVYIEDIYEQIGKLLNIVDTGTPEQVRFLAFHLFDKMIGFVGLINKSYYLSASTRAQRALSLPINVPSFKALGTLILQGRMDDVRHLGDLGRQLFDETAAYVARLGIEVEETRLRVE